MSEGAEGPLDGLRDDLASQRDFVAERVPVYARLLELLPGAIERGRVRSRLRKSWSDRTFGAWYERPLLLLACLRDDALEEGSGHPLFEAIGRDGGGGDATEPGPVPGAEAGGPAVTSLELEAALSVERPIWHKLRTRHVQTNETSRAVAWLWPAHLIGTADPGCTLDLFDVGASAGLNLIADALPRIWSRSDEAMLDVDPLPAIEKRQGYDLRPLDAGDDETARWLRACVWPGQDDRVARLEAGIRAWRDADPRPELLAASAGDVPDLLARGAAGPEPGGTGRRRTLAYQSVVRDYLPEGERARYEEGMRRWLEESEPGAAVWMELEVEPDLRDGGPPAALTAHLAKTSVVLATCHPHPSELEVDEGAVRAFLEAVEPA